MSTRCIMLTPAFADLAKIEEVRRRYDPLYGKVGPHLTLVFPFECDLQASELEVWMRSAMRGLSSFPLRLQGVTKADNGYLFLQVREGREHLQELHRRLYAALREGAGLELPLLRPYEPHLTIGRLGDASAQEAAMQELSGFIASFETIITELIMEQIAPDDSSIIECRVPFKG